MEWLCSRKEEEEEEEKYINFGAHRCFFHGLFQKGKI
jgi:hypothetical protein